MSYHNPVMLQECMQGLAIDSNGTYVDVTFGGGGHSKEILNHLSKNGKLVAFDQDLDAIENKIEDSRLLLIRDNFKNMEEHLRQQGFTPIKGILADLGVSSHQFDKAERGFSIRFDHNLDMRMDDRITLTALEILNTYQERKLVSVFSQYGEVHNAKTLAATIVAHRTNKLFENSNDFRSAIQHLIPKQNESTYLAQVYQALRIEVNDELGALKSFLTQSSSLLEKGGRLVVMSYHSLEDRLVKNYIAKGNFEGNDEKDIYGNNINLKFRAINKKPITPNVDEIKNNPRSRSAKLRIAEKL